MPEVDAVTLPRTLRAAVRGEFARALRPPYETLITVAANGIFMCSAWFFLPRALKNHVFTLHGMLAFALVLAAWMYSVPATNVLGPDRHRVMAAIDDPVMLRRLLYAKNIVLWTFITPVCSVIALVTGILGHNLLATLLHRHLDRSRPIRRAGNIGVGGDSLPVQPPAVAVPVGASLAATAHARAMADAHGHSLSTFPALAVALMIPSLLLWLHLGAWRLGETARP